MHVSQSVFDCGLPPSVVVPGRSRDLQTSKNFQRSAFFQIAHEAQHPQFSHTENRSGRSSSLGVGLCCRGAGRNFAHDVKTLKFEDDIFDEGRGKHIDRKLTVSGSDAFGLPMPVDRDVLLVLMHLTNMQMITRSSNENLAKRWRN